MEEADEKRLELDQWRYEREFQIREKALDLETERLRESAHTTRSRLFSSRSLTISSLLAGVLGTFLGATIQGFFNLDLEVKKLESSLIIQAIKTGNNEESAKNLNFLVSAGFIDDPENKITSLIKSSETTPVLPKSENRSGRTDTELNRMARSAFLGLDDAKIINIQKDLRRLGYYSGPIDALYGGVLARALSQFREDQGLSPTQIHSAIYKLHELASEKGKVKLE